MRRTSFVAAFAAVAAASPLSAQTWQTITSTLPTGSGAYWRNTSDDNVTPGKECNAGAILTNTPNLAATDCVNQVPVYIPLSPAPLTLADSYLGNADGSHVAGGFRFAAGLYNFGALGRVEGIPTPAWGIVTDGGTVFSAAQLLTGSPVSVSGAFAVWIEQALPLAGAGTFYTSAMTSGLSLGALAGTSNQQFAVFSANPGSFNAGVIGFSSNSTYYVGMEDNVNCGRGFGANCTGTFSDRDYNDIIISIQAVPEPATVGLMGFGLLALAGVAKRRKA